MIEAFGIALLVVSVLGVLALGCIGILLGFQRVDRGLNFFPSRPITAKHKHKFTKWEVVRQLPIYLYPEPDLGRDLPDRMDVMLKRECVRCGLPETRTVRGA